MILGTGADIVNIDRIAKLLAAQGDKFLQRCFTPAEQDYAARKTDDMARAGALAKRFAAKEACAKALGTGIADGISFTDIGVVHNEKGAPSLELTGAAAQRLREITPDGQSAHLHLSLSDDHPFAQAFIVIEGQQT